MSTESGSRGPEERDNSHATILIADDFEGWRVRIRRILEQRSEWEIVCEVSDGLQAVKNAVQLKPDVVLLDISMPGLSGIDAASEIRRLSPASKIIFVSQQMDKAIIRAAIASGAHAYVLKSNMLHALIPAIADALGCKGE